MKSPLIPSIHIAIVDSTPQDYISLLFAAQSPGVSIHFLLRGNDALRFAKRYHSVVWVINSRLPDMTGFDLAEMLRTVRRSAAVYLICDEYREEDEMRALTLGLAKYLCKPLEPSWVLPHRRDFCIPLPTCRSLSSALRIVAPVEYDGKDGALTALSLPGANERADEDQVILPFNPNLRQRPAA